MAVTHAPLPTAVSSVDALIASALSDVTKHGRHLSSVIDDMFGTLRPAEHQASAIRAELYRALRTTPQPGNELLDSPECIFPGWLRSRLTIEQQHWAVTDASTIVRVNTLKANRNELLERLSPHDPELIDGSDIAIRIGRPFGLFRTAAYRDGWFEQQDAASQRVAVAVDAQPGMRIVDACAGNGGKTLHLAALMQNKGRIIALDPHEHKLAVLRSRCARAGVSIAEPRQITSTKIVKRLADTADRVLIDAPCTGTGVLRRNPDLVWHISEQSFHILQTLQSDILWRSSRMARVGGKVVYATCSLLREEGEDQIYRFLDHHKEFVMDEELRLGGSGTSDDGFYIAVLTKQDSA